MDLLIIFFIIGRKKFPNLEKSNFEPYFQFLPQSFSTLPFTWNADQIDYFDTFDRSDVYQEIDLVEETFKKIKSALEASKLFTKYYELSKSDFLWAFSIIRTRSFSCCALRNYELPQDLRNRNKNKKIVRLVFFRERTKNKQMIVCGEMMHLFDTRIYIYIYIILLVLSSSWATRINYLSV